MAEKDAIGKEERTVKTRVTHHRANKRGKTPSKSIRCSEGGGERSVERTFRQPRMHYLPPGVFYDFLGSHNKVRQRVSHNGSSLSHPPSFVGSLVSSDSVFYRTCRHCLSRVDECPRGPRKYTTGRDTKSFMPIILDKVSEAVR